MLFRTALTASFLTLGLLASAQGIDKTKLALDVAAANEANNAKLKEYIWKLKLDGYVNKELKLTTLTEMKFGPDGKLVATPIDQKTTVKAKPGIRGNMQKSPRYRRSRVYADACSRTPLRRSWTTSIRPRK